MIKKVLLLLGLMVFSAIPSFAICEYSILCPPQAYDLSTKTGQFVSKATGATSLSEKIAQSKIKHELKKATNQKFNVSVKSYSIQDLIHGRFKSIVISGKNLEIEGVYLSSLELKTLCDFNYVKFDKTPIVFKENMVVGFSTEISSTDLIKTMNSTGYLDRINCVNVEGCGITFFKLSGADIKIKNNKLYFTIKITSHLLLAKPITVVISTDLKVQNGRIVLTKIDFGKTTKGVDLRNLTSQLNAMNPLAFTFEVLENKNTKMCIKNIKIHDDKITVNGHIFIPKNSTN